MEKNKARSSRWTDFWLRADKKKKDTQSPEVLAPGPKLLLCCPPHCVMPLFLGLHREQFSPWYLCISIPLEYGLRHPAQCTQNRLKSGKRCGGLSAKISPVEAGILNRSAWCIAGIDSHKALMPWHYLYLHGARKPSFSLADEKSSCYSDMHHV